MKPDLITITTPESSETYVPIEPEKLEELRGIVGELAGKDESVFWKDEQCIFCGVYDDPEFDYRQNLHDANCLVTRAKEAMEK